MYYINLLLLISTCFDSLFDLTGSNCTVVAVYEGVETGIAVTEPGEELDDPGVAGEEGGAGVAVREGDEHDSEGGPAEDKYSHHNPHHFGQPSLHCKVSIHDLCGLGMRSIICTENTYEGL